MNLLDTVVIILCAVGLITLLTGIFISKYPRTGRFLKLKNNLSIEYISNIKPIKAFLKLLTKNKNGKLYRFSLWIIKSSEMRITVQTLYLLKIASLILISILVLLIRFTNIEAVKITIISKPPESFAFFQDKSDTNYSFNITLYNAVIERIGEKKLKALNEEEKEDKAKSVIAELIQTRDREIIEEKTVNFIKTYNAVTGIKLIDWKSFLIIIFSFWLPEVLLFLKKLLLSNRYKKEVIKLENIFELLGSIKGFKTIDIIEEMGKSSKPYKRHLRSCMETFKTDKELALESLRATIKNNRFSKLVDVMRIYALVDKDLALKILERNKHEKEEEVLLTAEEDIDVVDVIAFISVVPILLEIANLLMKPMLDMIYQAFQYI